MSENIHGEFLAGNDLSYRIKKVCSGDDVKCAVAFWGNNAEVTLFHPPQIDAKKFKIICDISMGGTNPETIKQLGAPENPNLKHIEGLHAKVYISNSGCVIGSANASDNGVGFQNSPKHLEAGVYHLPGSKVWEEVGKWFEKTFSDAKALDSGALEKCENKWEKRKAASQNIALYDSDLELDNILKAYLTLPEVFSNIGVLFSFEDVTEKQCQYISKMEKKIAKSRGETFPSEENLGYWLIDMPTKRFPDYCNDKLPEYFLSIHLEGGKLELEFYERINKERDYFGPEVPKGGKYSQVVAEVKNWNSKIKELGERFKRNSSDKTLKPGDKNQIKIATKKNIKALRRNIIDIFNEKYVFENPSSLSNYLRNRIGASKIEEILGYAVL